MRRRIKDSLKAGSLLLVALAGIAVIAIPIFSQAPGATRPSFEVVSIKLRPGPVTRILITAQPGRFVGEGMSLKMLAARAYGVPELRIAGGPNWVESDHFDIEAKAEGAIPPGQLGLYLQSMLEDRFQIKVHREMRELPTYTLVVAKDGPKIKLSADQTPPGPLAPPERGTGPRGEPGPGLRGGPGGPVARGGPGGPGGPGNPPFGPGNPQPRGTMGVGRGNISGSAARIATIANFLSQQLGRPVVDKTNLDGLYDFTLQWTPGSEQAPGPFGAGPDGVPPPADPSGPSIFTAVQEQLGLRLESTKGPVEVVVIDSAQKPSEN